jgi:hypothetical protein
VRGRKPEPKARHIIENDVFVVTISQYIKPKAIEDKIGTDPVYNNLITKCNNELANGSRTALECFATDARYTIKNNKPGFSVEVMMLAEETEIHHDLGMKYENMEAISTNRADFLRQKVASQSATTKEMICLEKYYFEEVDEKQRGEFWDGGLTRTARALSEYRKPNCRLRAKLPGFIARIDDILAGSSVCDPAEVVKAAFSDYLDQATVNAIKDRYPEHQRKSTWDEKYRNVVMNEV